jgi:dihydropteroate synthase
MLAHGRSLELGEQAIIMGILNVTPDSFSDGGRFEDMHRALEQAARMAGEGALIIDVGGESTRPGAVPISAAEEQERALPIVEALAARGDVLISIDTYRAETADLAIRAGAHIINDIRGLQGDGAMAAVASRHRAGLVIMHNSRDRACLPDPIEDQLAFLGRSLRLAEEARLEAEQIVLDPGFGFGKDAAENLAIMARFEELQPLGRPWLVGTSRKRFLGHVTGRPQGERDVATAASSVVLRLKGAALFRVHDVAINRDALAVADAMLAPRHHL